MDAPQATPRTKDIARYQTFLKTRPPGPYAYTVLLGMDCFDFTNVMKAVQKGFRWKSFEGLARNMNIPHYQIAEMIGVSRRTLARRKLEKRFQLQESDRLLRIARVFARTLQLFDGDRDAATEWLTHRSRHLGGATPLEYSRFDIGATEVERLIGCIEHGIYM
jgi:putative toxin-antitoxin system antitoxin component (TIGR02293 family)